MKGTGPGATGAIVGLPSSGSAYTESLYDAVRRRGALVRDGVWSGRWLLANVGRGDTLHLHWPSFQYYDPASLRGTTRGLLRFVGLCSLLKLRGVQVLWTAHNLYPHDGGKAVWQHRAARRFVTSIATRIFVHGPTAARIVAQEFQVPPGKLRVVPHGHWLGAFPASAGRAAARRSLGVDDATHVHLFFGLCKPYKGLEALIESVARSPAGSRLVIAGKFQSSDYERRIADLARQAGADRVQVHSGYVDDADVARFFDAADSVVLPYREILTSGAAMLAMSFGKPVVAPRKGTLVDAVTDASGVLYDDASPDALTAALQSVRVHAFDEACIRAHAGRSTWDDNADALIRAHRNQDAASRHSYWKTTLLALGGAIAAATAGALLPGSFALLAWLAAAACGLVVVAGLVVLRRDSRDRHALPDRFHELFNRVPSSTGLRRWIRPLLGSAPRPGDTVEVLGAAAIHATLDASGRLDGLPFMPEMLSCIGRRFVVDRRIDKINDWLGDNEKRSVRDIVTLVNERCSGSGHGHCQAACQTLWHERWLRRIDARAPSAPQAAPSFEDLRRLVDAASVVPATAGAPPRYACQITELPRISTPISPRDWRQDVRPVLLGNLPVSAWLLALCTRLFNRVQAVRRGAEYPASAPQLPQGPTPGQRLDLQPGERVRVKSKQEIALTLYRNRNRGMWFGRETLRFCNREYRVRSRVEHLIEERTGRMLELETPCVILDGVSSPGEFLRFCPQSEYVFWREIWLERVDRA